MAQKEGLEPPTKRLTAACSTDWATSEHSDLKIKVNYKLAKSGHFVKSQACILL